MILDQIKNASFYEGILPAITTALEKAAAYTPEHYPGGRIDVDGDNLFLLLNTYDTHTSEGALFEAHKAYIDVMYMVDGEEIIYVKPTDTLCSVTKPYDSSIDALLANLDRDATPVRLTAGSFIVLFPQDAHAPGCYDQAPKTVKKIIAKVKIN